MYSHLFALTNHDHLVQVKIIKTLLHNQKKYADTVVWKLC